MLTVPMVVLLILRLVRRSLPRGPVPQPRLPHYARPTVRAMHWWAGTYWSGVQP